MMSCRRLYINDEEGCLERFRPRSLSAMSLLTELRIGADLDEGDSLESLTMLQKLAIDYEHINSWREPAFPIVISDAAKVTELHITVDKEVSRSGWVSLPCC